VRTAASTMRRALRRPKLSTRIPLDGACSRMIGNVSPTPCRRVQSCWKTTPKTDGRVGLPERRGMPVKGNRRSGPRGMARIPNTHSLRARQSTVSPAVGSARRRNLSSENLEPHVQVSLLGLFLHNGSLPRPFSLHQETRPRLSFASTCIRHLSRSRLWSGRRPLFATLWAPIRIAPSLNAAPPSPYIARLRP